MNNNSNNNNHTITKPENRSFEKFNNDGTQTPTYKKPAPMPPIKPAKQDTK